MTLKPTILTLEDDEAIRRGIVDVLTFAGYNVIESGDGESGCQMALLRDYDLLLLDLVLPHKSGLEILKEVRNTKPTVPIIVLSARGDENDRVSGLRLGADDYVVKPFSVNELLARVNAVLRRSPGRPCDVQDLQIGDTKIDLDRCEICFDNGERVELTERERELLRYLARHSDRAIAREELLSNVWHIDARGASTRTIDMAIARLREKLRDESLLVTVRGKGYMIAISESPTNQTD